MRLVASLFCLLGSISPPLAQETQSSHSGRIESTAVAGSCSAVLLDRSLVMTAGHCVRPDRNWYIFRPGDGDFPGVTHEIDQVIRHPKYESMPRSLARQKYDIALAWLVRPVPERRLAPISMGEPARNGERLSIESWRQDGTQSPSRQSCVVIDGFEEQVTLACEVAIGDSGAPVLRRGQNGMELVAIVTTRAKLGDKAVALATNAKDHFSLLISLANPR